LLSRHDIQIPKTVVLHPENQSTPRGNWAFPACSSGRQLVLPRRGQGRQPKRTREQLKILFEDSDLVVAQEFLPTTFDWRIGILNRKPIYACKYFMAENHWQIIHQDSNGDSDYGKYETIPVELAPRRARGAALQGRQLIGDGLYGVDVKESNKKFYVIEVKRQPEYRRRR